MKRLALLAVTAFIAVVLSACGENAQKKVENNAANNVEQTQDSLGDAAKDAVQPNTGADTTVTTPNDASKPADQSGH